MNRRNFISLLSGAAGATLVPWRGLPEPVIFLPPARKIQRVRLDISAGYLFRVRADYSLCHVADAFVAAVAVAPGVPDRLPRAEGLKMSADDLRMLKQFHSTEWRRDWPGI